MPWVLLLLFILNNGIYSFKKDYEIIFNVFFINSIII